MDLGREYFRYYLEMSRFCFDFCLGSSFLLQRYHSYPEAHNDHNLHGQYQQLDLSEDPSSPAELLQVPSSFAYQIARIEFLKLKLLDWEFSWQDLDLALVVSNLELCPVRQVRG